MSGKLEEIFDKISDVENVAIMALERLNCSESVQIATVLKMNRRNIDELQELIHAFEEEK